MTRKIGLLSLLIGALLGFALLLFFALTSPQKTADKATPLTANTERININHITLPRLFPENTPAQIDSAMFLLNVWGTWCRGCHAEHPNLLTLAEHVPIIGINWHDDNENARAYLQQFGNPYRDVFLDADGEFVIGLGVFAAPESFLVSATGRVIWQHKGVLTPQVIETDLMPLLQP